MLKRVTLVPVRHLLVSVALVAVTACTPSPAAAPPPEPAQAGGAFEGCSGVFTSVLGWTFTCDATSVVTREGDDAEALLRGARESMRGGFSGPVEEHRRDVLVGGVARKGLDLSLRTARKQVVAVGTAAILETDAAPTRLVACLAGADEASQARCRQQLDELATMTFNELPPPSVRLQPRPLPAIAGRPVVEPHECHLAANDRAGLLDCGDAVLGWSEPIDPKVIPSERDATIEDTTRKMKLASPGAQPPKRTSTPCHVEGVAATCTVVRWPDVTLTLGTAVVRGHSILAWCIAHDASTSRICSDSVNTGPSSTAVGAHPY
jgi:hypothetical protein